VTIVAWSSGAQAALLYARDHPRRVDRLLLLNPLLPSWQADEALMAELDVHGELDARTQALWAEDLLADRPLQHERLLDRLTHAPLTEPHRRWLWQRLMFGAPHAQVKTWEELRQHDVRSSLGDVQAPVTIISGSQDRLAPSALGAYLATALPRAQQIVLEHCGHASFLEQRQAVLQAIADLLRIDDPTVEEGEETAMEDLVGEAAQAAAPEEHDESVVTQAGEAAATGDVADPVPDQGPA
jgi:pimeloyl-ACP methyl ester carboxylesterase